MRNLLLAAIAALALACPASAASLFSVVSQPVTATAASASAPAAANNSRHVAVGAIVCISAVAAQPDIIFNLRDGATGAGTILATWRLAAASGTSKCETLPLAGEIPGTRNTAMTLESASAPAATNFATATLLYFDTI